MNILAIIPSRSESKRLPGKNKKYILGKPLIQWTIEQAQKSKLISRLIVDTDDKDIIQLAENLGVEYLELPKELTQDNASIYDVIFFELDCLKKEGKEYDIVILLEPTSPIRRDGDIDGAIQILLDNYNSTDSVVSLGKIQLETPNISKVVIDDRVKPLMISQRNGDAYFPYGVIYLSKVEALRKYKTFYQERTMPYFISREQCYEINDEYDFTCVEAIIKNL